MFSIVTDLEPYFLRIQLAFGRLMPIGVEGKQSPPSAAAVMTLAETPLTSFFLKQGSTGEWSSNHWALAEMVSARFVAARSLKLTTDSQLAFIPNGSL